MARTTASMAGGNLSGLAPQALPTHRRSIWVPLAIGLLLLYGPTLLDLVQGAWGNGEQGHGPIILAICCWLMYRQWPQMLSASEGHPSSRWGWPLLVVGLVLYVVGRSQGILFFEVGSVVWVFSALLLLTLGRQALRQQWFPLMFLVFMIPLPAQVVDTVTMPMKIAVSYVVETVLYYFGYPVARTGVILQVGQYKLLVADACAGLHTLLTLEALGLLYLNLVRRDSVFRNTLLATLIIPISFTANVIRVAALVLITYHFGDAAGQGFLHGFAGMVLFLSALCLIIALDSVLHGIEKMRARPKLAAKVVAA